MTTIDKTLDKMRNNQRNWRIEDLLVIARRYGIKARTSGGSHVHFYHENLKEHLSIPAHRPIKPVYIVEFLRFLDALKEKTS